MIIKAFTVCILAVIGWKDQKTMEIPYGLNAALGICALLNFLTTPEPALLERLLGALCVSVPMFLLCLIIESAFGGGDILLLLIMGFYLGWRAVLTGTFFGFLFGGMEAVWLLGTGRVKRGEGAHMAFGPALCLGLTMGLFYGEEIFAWYVSLLL